jgi:hypothetical protein
MLSEIYLEKVNSVGGFRVVILSRHFQSTKQACLPFRLSSSENVKLFLGKHYAMKAYGEEEV